MEKWGPKRNCFRISDSVATQKGDGVMNRSSFAVAASFSIAASVAFGSMGYSAAYAGRILGNVATPPVNST